MTTEETRINVTWTDIVTTLTKRTASVTAAQYEALIGEHAAGYADQLGSALDAAYSTPGDFQAFLSALAQTEGATAEVTRTEFDVDTMVDHDAGEHWCGDCNVLLSDHCSECDTCDCDDPDNPCDECGECGCDGDCVDESEDDEDESEDEDDD